MNTVPSPDQPTLLRNSQDECIDTQAALWLLASLAGFYRQPFDSELVIKRFPPPIDLPTLIEALDALGLKAGLSHWPKEGLSALPLPAVALLLVPTAEATPIAFSNQESAASPQAIPLTTLIPALIIQHGDELIVRVAEESAKQAARYSKEQYDQAIENAKNLFQ